MAICALSLVFLSKIFTSGKWQRVDLGEGWFCPSLPDLITSGINLGWVGHRQKAELSTL